VKILIIKLSAIGDVTMSLSMLDALKTYYGDVHITWVCGEIVRPILEKIPQIDNIITVNENSIFNKSKILQFKELMKILYKLFLRKYDKIIIGHADRRFRLLACTTLSKDKVAFNFKSHANLPLGTRFHGVDYAQLATNEHFIKEYKLIYPNLSAIVKSYFPLIENNSKKKILLFPGGANNILSEQFLRRWEIQNYQELANKLLLEGYQVIIAGAKTDSWISEYFNENIINLVGKTNLIETIGLINDCSIVVTHDSGPLHLSLHLAKKKTIALFGPVLAEARIAVNCDNAIVMKSTDSLNCMPCYDGKKFAKCEDNICMQGITVENVYHQIIKELKMEK